MPKPKLKRFGNLTPEEQAGLQFARRLGILEYSWDAEEWDPAEQLTSECMPECFYRIRPCPNNESSKT
jgi:hypothetical protein